MKRSHALRSASTGLFACATLLTSLACALRTTAAHAAEPTAAPKPGADGWYEGTPPDGSFRVLGPVPFQGYASEDKAKPKEQPATQGVRASQVGAFDATTKYVANCNVDPSDRRGDKARLQSTLVQWTSQVAAAYERPITAGPHAGIEFEISDPNKTLRVRLIAAPERICTLFVQWNPVAKPREADIDRFLGSFALAER
jgi:hypothetical protein